MALPEFRREAFVWAKMKGEQTYPDACSRVVLGALRS